MSKNISRRTLVTARRKAWALVAAVPMLLIGLSISPASAGDVVVPAAIPADCSADVTDALNAWLDSVPNGSTAQLAANGCYQVDRTLFLRDKSDVIFDGNGSTLVRKTPTPPEMQNGNPANTTHTHNRHLVVDNSDHVTVQNVTIRGLNTVSDIDPASPRAAKVFEPTKFGSRWQDANYGEAGLVLFDSEYVTIQGVNTDATWGDGIMVGNETYGLSSHIVVKDTTIDRNGRQGVALVAVDGILFDNVKVLHSYLTGWDLEPLGAASLIRNVEIRNSYINSFGIAVSVTGNDVAIARGDNLYVHNNVIKSTLTSWPWFNGSNGANQAPRQNWRITDNVVQVASFGMVLGNVTDAVVRNNVAPMIGPRGAATYDAIRMTNMHGTVAIHGNETVPAVHAYSTDGVGGATILACGNRISATTAPVSC